MSTAGGEHLSKGAGNGSTSAHASQEQLGLDWFP